MKKLILIILTALILFTGCSLFEFNNETYKITSHNTGVYGEQINGLIKIDDDIFATPHICKCKPEVIRNYNPDSALIFQYISVEYSMKTTSGKDKFIWGKKFYKEVVLKIDIDTTHIWYTTPPIE